MRHAYLITRQMRVTSGFTSIANLSLVSPGGTISYHHSTLTSLLPLLSNSFMSRNLQTKLILVIMYEVPTLNTAIFKAILSIMMSLQIRSIGKYYYLDWTGIWVVWRQPESMSLVKYRY